MPWKSKFCREKVSFAVEKYVLPWQMWATVSTCFCSSVFRPSGHGKLFNLLGFRQLWLNLQTENNFCRHIYSWFCTLSHIFLRRNRTTKPTQQGELRKKDCSCRARTRPKFSYISLLAQTPNPLVQALETYMKNKLFNETNRSPTFFMLTLTLCFQTSWKGAIN